jgi:bifunctional oligoribonuclease and PAP phosphatase NrnA
MKGRNKMNRILEKIKEHQVIIIHGHKRPDGDCYGSQFGLKDVIKTSFPKKEVYVVGEKSNYVDFLGKIDTVSDDKFKGALSIVVDTATEERISDDRYKLSKTIIKIDHHIPVDDYGDIRWVQTNFPSCAQMISYFYYTYKDQLKISLKGANALYTGMVTDTGRFRFRGVSQVTHQLAGLMLSKGVDVEYIDSNLSKETLEVIALKGYVYSNFVITPGGFVYIKMTRDIIEKYDVTDEQASSVVGLLGGIEGYPVWALFIEYNDEVRIRLRSSGPDVNVLANKYQGGGHAKAAGAKLENWDHLDRFVFDVEALIKNHIKD